MFRNSKYICDCKRQAKCFTHCIIVNDLCWIFNHSYGNWRIELFMEHGRNYGKHRSKSKRYNFV